MVSSHGRIRYEQDYEIALGDSLVPADEHLLESIWVDDSSQEYVVDSQYDASRRKVTVESKATAEDPIVSALDARRPFCLVTLAGRVIGIYAEGQKGYPF